MSFPDSSKVTAGIPPELCGSATRIVLPTFHWGAAGGLEIHLGAVAGALAKAGCDVTPVAVFNRSAEAVNGIRCVPLAPTGGFLANRWYSRFRWGTVLEREVRSQASPGAILLVGHANLLPALKRLINAQVFARTWLWTYGLDVWGEPGRRLAVKIESVDRVVSISRFTAERMRDYLPSLHPAVIPCAVDTQLFQPAVDASEIRRNEILICGRISRVDSYKGHEILLRALKVCVSQHGKKNYLLRVVGDGDLRPQLEGLAAELGISENVRFEGRVPLKTLVAFYQRCGVFCMPSRVERRNSGYWGGEGFGIVYIEAAACGRPVIGSRDGGAQETVTHGLTGYLADPNSADELAGLICQVLENPELADQMGRHGRQWVETEFSGSRLDQRIRQFFDDEKGHICAE